MASIKRIGKDKLGVPIWEAVYRRVPGGKQIRRRFHLASKADVERAILLDSGRSGFGLKWSEGAKVYLDAKLAEGIGARSLENVERAVNVFLKIMGDKAIENTTAAMFKEFMQAVATKPMWNGAIKKQKISGPKVANECRIKLLTIATYLLKHTSAISTVPFKDVPPLPVRREQRVPIPDNQVNLYLDALPPYLRRPVLMVLYYGLRSTAVCNIGSTPVDTIELVAIDKNEMVRRIPVDETLAGILKDAQAHRESFQSPAGRLFVNSRGRPWDRSSLLHAVQKAWKAAGLERKKIHEVRHTLGTMAGKIFTPGMVQAAMGHRSRKSSEAYFHPTEDMAAAVRQKIITELSQIRAKTEKNDLRPSITAKAKKGKITRSRFAVNP